jgi:cytochrome P450
LALEEVLRHDPPVQNTRRFVARDGELAGRAVAVGDTVLVVLAAANRDPALVAEPDRFDLDRADRRQLTLGAGTHACPGGALALAIAEAAVARLLANGLDLEPLATPVGYRPSANTRIPVFGEEVDG